MAENKKTATTKAADEKAVTVVAIEPLYVKGKTIAIDGTTTLPESAAKILADKNKLRIKE